MAQELSAKRRGRMKSFWGKFLKTGELAGASGQGSVERKINLGADLCKVSILSVRFVVRIPLGTMRLGFSEKTVLGLSRFARRRGNFFGKGSTFAGNKRSPRA